MTDRKTLDQMTSDELDQLYKERDEARQHAAAIAAQRDRLRQRMNTLADRWDHALPVDQPYARTLRAEISVDPFDPDGAMTVQEYTERGRRLWAFRCWGTETCDGWLGLGHHTQTSALLERERHVAEAHTEPTAEARLAHLQTTSEAAGILLTRTTDERDQLQATLTRVRQLAERWRHTGDRKEGPLRELLAALDEPTPTCREHDGPCFPAPTAKCPAHGEQQCTACHRNPSTCADPDYVECGFWSATGMHWDTCPNRIRGPLAGEEPSDA